MRKFLRNSASLMVIALAVAAGIPKAQAGLLIQYSLDGGTTFLTLASGASGSAVSASSTTLGAFAISNFSTMSNSPGTAQLAKVLSSSLDIQNVSGATTSIEFTISDTGFTAPTAPPVLRLDSHIGGSITVDNVHNLASFTSCLSITNANLTSCVGATYVDGPGTPDITASSFNNTRFLDIAALTEPYSITQILNVTLGAGSDAGFMANTALLPIPEPLSLSLLGAALIGLGVMRHGRR